jgi:hypothetical protein
MDKIIIDDGCLFWVLVRIMQFLSIDINDIKNNE